MCIRDRDATDELALETLPLREIDVVIVAIGENFGASVRVVALLKQKKVKHIFARAIDVYKRQVLYFRFYILKHVH